MDGSELDGKIIFQHVKIPATHFLQNKITGTKKYHVFQSPEKAGSLTVMNTVVFSVFLRY